LADGARLETATVICTIGTRPNPLIETLGLPTARGPIVVNGDLSVRDAPGLAAGLWAIGDCALVPNAHDGKSAPPTAQFAVREAACLAHNLAAVLAGRPTRGVKTSQAGQVAGV